MDLRLLRQQDAANVTRGGRPGALSPSLPRGRKPVTALRACGPRPRHPRTCALREQGPEISLSRPRSRSTPRAQLPPEAPTRPYPTRPDLSSRGADPPPALFSSRPCCRSRRRPLAPDLILGISAGSGRTGPGSQRGPEPATPVMAPRGNRRPHRRTTPSPLDGAGRGEGPPPGSLWAPPPRKRAGLGAQGPPGIVVMN